MYLAGECIEIHLNHAKYKPAVSTCLVVVVSLIIFVYSP